MNSVVKPIRFHKTVEKELGMLDVFTRTKIFEVLALIAQGQSLGLPLSRPMSIVAHGTHELRIKTIGGQYRIFYFVKFAEAILVFHFYKKKTRETPMLEIAVAKKRLREM